MSQERRRRIFRILRVFAVSLVFLLLFAPFALGFLTIWGISHTGCGADVSPDAYGMNDYESIRFFSQALDADVQGYFVHGSNGITILIPPVLGSGPGNWMQEYNFLNAQGYNLMTYASRNCLGYPNTLGYRESTEVSDALDYLATRQDVDMERIGVFGFSAGGATATLAAALHPRIGAVIAMGGYHDFAEEVNKVAAGTWYGPLYRAGAELSYWLVSGQSLSVLSPIRAIQQIGSRPILLIYGTKEPGLPGARLQLVAAGDNAELLVIEDATHGSYRIHAPDLFDKSVLDFLRRAFVPAA